MHFLRPLSIVLLFTGLCCPAVYAQRTLSDYIEAAKTNSPLINDNKNQSIANKAEAERLKAMLTKPQLGVTANYLLAPVYDVSGNKDRLELNPNKNTPDYYGYDLGATNGGTYQALLTLTQPLFNGSVSETISNQVRTNAAINDNQIRLSGHDLEKLVTDQYILCLQDKKQISYVSEILGLMSQQTGIVKKLVTAGLLKSTDLTLLNIERENNIGLLNSYEASYKRNLLDLNILAGIKDTSTVALDSISLSLKSEVANSGYMDKYRLDSLGLVAGQKVFETKYRPRINLFANTGLNGIYVPTLPNRFGVSGGLSLTWNFFDGGQKKLSQQKTNALLQSVSGYKEQFQTQNMVRKAKILDEIAAYERRMNNFRAQLSSYNDLINTYKKEIIVAQLSIIDFINVLKNRSATERDYVLLETNRQLLINAYNYWNW